MLPFGALSAISGRAWAAIGVGVLVLALVAGLLVTRDRLSDTKRERDAVALKLSVSNGSVDRLEKEMNKVREVQMALANEDANRITASRQAIQLADAAAAVRSASIDKLHHSAEMIRGPTQEEQCSVSDAVNRVWPL